MRPLSSSLQQATRHLNLPLLHGKLSKRYYSWRPTPRPQLEFDPSDGLEPLFSPETLHQMYNVYQQELLARMRELTADTELMGLPPSQVLVQTQANSEQVELFNVSSQAWNMDFFLSSLTKNPRAMSHMLVSIFERDFGSVENMQQAISDEASGMFGSGWVWLCGDDKNTIKIMATYLSGTPMVPNRMTLNLLKQREEEADKPYKYIPLLGISCYEHAWRDFGIGEKAKQEYFKSVFKVINWEAVFQRMPQNMRDSRSSNW